MELAALSDEPNDGLATHGDNSGKTAMVFPRRHTVHHRLGVADWMCGGDGVAGALRKRALGSAQIAARVASRVKHPS